MLGYCFTPYQRLWLYNSAPLVAFYDTLGIRRTYSRLIPPASSRGKRGYSDLEIVDAVIRAVTSSTGLRNYLEGKQNFSLLSLRQILRAHYKEKSATELYGQLGQLTQSYGEEAQEFLLRALELRQKILFTSLEENADVAYDEGLVNKMFTRSVYTGLRSDVIRSEMKIFLETTTVDDEALIQTLSALSLREEDRENKLKS